MAEEVRNLAARSASAAKETTEMIEDSIKNVGFGTTIAKQTSEALNNIVDDVTKVAKLIDNIAIASNEQAIGVEQINQGIIMVSDVVQKNTATSEESAAASQELSSQAELLKEQVTHFKLRKSNNRTDNESNQPSKKEPSSEKASNKAKKRIILSDNKYGKY